MHLPDGFLSAPVSGALVIASAGAVGAAVARVSADQKEAGETGSTALMGVTAAFIFVAQMFNFPISGGTTGHLLGAALATALLGPWRAILVLAVVLLIQTFVFADGGVLAVGANIFNMGVAGCLLTGLTLPVLSRALGGRPWSRSVALALSAWLSVMLAAGLTGLEIALSGTVPAGVVLPAMLGVHAIIGLGEALLTVAAYQQLLGRRPDLLPSEGEVAAAERPLELGRVAAVLLLGLVAVRLAFPHPDGLEWVAEQQGFGERAAEAFRFALFPDYALRGGAPTEGFDWLGSYLSALVGMVLCAGAMILLGRRRTPAAQAPAE